MKNTFQPRGTAVLKACIDGDEYVRWPDNGVDENGLQVAAYQGTEKV